MGNLDLYNRYAQPPNDALKDFNNGKFKGTDINPMWRIRSLTEAFGPCGIGWYTEIVRMWREDTPDNAATVYCHIRLYTKQNGEWSKPIEGVGGNTLTRVTKSGSSTTDEAYKMAYTDAIGIACKALGFGADIWWKSNDSKYTAYQEDKPKQENKPFTPPAAAPAQVTVQQVYDYRPALKAFKKAYGVTDDQFAGMRKTLIAGGSVEDKSSRDMQEEDWNNLFNAMVQNFLGESA